MKKIEPISVRLQKALDIRNMKQTELVEKTKINKSSISTYLSGEYEPKQTNVFKMASALNVDPFWLLGCDVPMENEEQKIAGNMSFLKNNPDAVRILEYYSRLNPGERKEIEIIMKYKLDQKD